MLFDNNQASHTELKSILSERTTPVVMWVGAGLSKNGGMPLWNELRDKLVDRLQKYCNNLVDPQVLETKNQKLESARKEENLWKAFSILREGLGKTEYRSAIRNSLKKSDSNPVPNVYKQLWKLPIDGMVSLNVDRFAQRAFNEVNNGKKEIHTFHGTVIQSHTHALRRQYQWLNNLHGILDDESSWVFTSSELNKLQRSVAYKTFLTSLFTTRTVVFIGITADDVAVGGLLQHLVQQHKVDCGDHFWITDKTDQSTVNWAESNGVRQIIYKTSESHAGLCEVVSDISDFIPEDDSPAPISISPPQEYSGDLPSPTDLEALPSDQIRVYLNTHVSKILTEFNEKSLEEYKRFCTEYAGAIYRAWDVDTTPTRNEILGYELISEEAEGAFGMVYRAISPKGENVAVKILHERIRRKHEMLHSFRRGASSMKILTEHNVEGVVTYHDATEIPAMIVMDFVEGITLTKATEIGVFSGWKEIVRVGLQVALIIRDSHRLPQRVLHRDIRPNNVMLENCWTKNPEWEDVNVKVLDFDLSWHVDSFDVSVSTPGTANGFLAPEQVDRSCGMSTRHSGVDSYGMGMTLYYMRSKKSPRFSQHKFGDWKENLDSLVLNQANAE